VDTVSALARRERHHIRPASASLICALVAGRQDYRDTPFQIRIFLALDLLQITTAPYVSHDTQTFITEARRAEGQLLGVLGLVFICAG